MSSHPIPQKLRCTAAHWEEDDIKTLLQYAPEHLTQDELVRIVREMDRRFMQLWDKVVFEQKQGLLDYQRLKND